MMEKKASGMKSFFRLFRPGRKSLTVIFLLMFVFGYQAAFAAFVGPGFCASACIPCGPGPPCVFCPCTAPGNASDLSNTLYNNLNDALSDSADTLENYVNEKTDDLVETLLDSINKTELKTIDWWKTMWEKGLRPAMQKITQQLNVAIADQSRTLQSVVDAGADVESRRQRQGNEIENHRAGRPSENVCDSATLAGGYGRAENFARAMRNGWEKESVAIGLAQRGAPGAAAAAGAERRRYDEYRDLFCDPEGNGGHNECGASDPAYYNADTQPSRFIYNRLTADVTDPKMAKTLETINNNLVGVAATDPVSLGALQSATGQETFLAHRSYLARYAAIRAVPQLVTGWRVPGSHMGDWVRSLRQGAGVPLAEISANPSYREVMHASSVDRFNSGRYAVGMISDQNQVEMEKLTLDVFYLMQLRDYYELLERTALTLAVQVSMMTEQVPMPDTISVTPLR